jgi:hypothetical protein
MQHNHQPRLPCAKWGRASQVPGPASGKSMGASAAPRWYGIGGTSSAGRGEPDNQATTYSIFWYGMVPDVTSRKGLPFFTPTVANPVAVDRKERKPPGMTGFK